MTWMAQRDNAHFAKSLKVLVEFLLKLIGQVTGRKGHRMVSRVLLMLKVKTKSCTRTLLGNCIRTLSGRKPGGRVRLG